MANRLCCKRCCCFNDDEGLIWLNLRLCVWTGDPWAIGLYIKTVDLSGKRMIMGRIVNLLFRWGRLRVALMDEVHMYDYLDEAIKDTTPGSAYWNDGDGWRSWTYSAERKKYYFNDIPVEYLGDAMTYTYESLGYEFDMDEVW